MFSILGVRNMRSMSRMFSNEYTERILEDT